MCDDQQTALFCYYCHNPVILAGKMTGDFKPNKVIGFKLTRDQAVDKFKDWCGKKMFIPKDFKSEQQIEKITGLYVPFWVADCGIRADFSAVGKNIRTWSSGNYVYTETKEYRVVRDADMKDFSMSYLSGFFADKYDVDKAGVFPRIKSRASQAGKNVIRDSISSYSKLSVTSEDYKVQNTNWKYAMLPIWFMSYKYHDDVYEFAVNGQTGKLAGTPPLDKRKLKLFSAALGAGVMLLVYLGGMLFK